MTEQTEDDLWSKPNWPHMKAELIGYAIFFPILGLAYAGCYWLGLGVL